SSRWARVGSAAATAALLAARLGGVAHAVHHGVAADDDSTHFASYDPGADQPTWYDVDDKGKGGDSKPAAKAEAPKAPSAKPAPKAEPAKPAPKAEPQKQEP